MNQILLNINSPQFADNTKLYRVVKCSEDVVKLQKDPDIAMEWSLHKFYYCLWVLINIRQCASAYI